VTRILVYSSNSNAQLAILMQTGHCNIKLAIEIIQTGNCNTILAIVIQNWQFYHKLAILIQAQDTPTIE